MNDFLVSPIGDDPVICKTELKASPERVFKAWTDPEEIKSWFGYKPYSVQAAEIDLRVGGKWLFTFDLEEATYNAIGGEYLVIKEHAQLTFTWRHERAAPEGEIVYSPVSEVDVEIRSLQTGSILTVTHRNLETRDARQNVTSGWAPALQSLMERFETDEQGMTDG